MKPEMKSQEEVKQEAKRMAGKLHKAVLAGVGAVGMAQDKRDALLERLVARGELAEKDARKMVDDIQQQVQKRRAGSAQRAEKQFNGLLHRLNLPSRAEITNLSQQVESLSTRIEELKAEINRTQS